MTAANGATYAFSRRPLSRPYRLFIGRTLKGSKGSNSPVRQAVGGCPVIAHETATSRIDVHRTFVAELIGLIRP